MAAGKNRQRSTGKKAHKVDESAYFWRVKSSRGRKPIFKSPEELAAACEEYFEWVVTHPLNAAELVKHQGAATVAFVPKMRAMTISALCIFLDISMECWTQYREREEFVEICKSVEEIIRAQKFEGAAADLLNHAIIARDLGLREKVDTEHSGAIRFADMTDDALDARIKALLGKQ